MDWWVLGLLSGLVALGTVDVYPNEDLVLRLPGQPKVDFRQFAGYVDVDKKSGRSLFYYFAEADGDAENKPLTLWLNGGVRLQNRAPFFLEAMVTAFEEIQDHGIKIGNPLLNPKIDFQERYRFFWSNGVISDELSLSIMSHCDFDHLVFSDPYNVTIACYEAIADVDQMVSRYVNRYNVILDICYPSIVEQEFRLRKFATKMSIRVDVCMTRERDFYFNLPEVQHALHAKWTNLLYKWVHCTDLLNYNQTDGDAIMVPFLKRIIQHGIPVWIYSGDQDSVIPVTGSQRIIRGLAHDLNFKITVPYGVWFHKGQVGGWATEYGNLLTFATVRRAGHMVPYAQPGRALLLFKSFISGKRLPNTTHPSIY